MSEGPKTTPAEPDIMQQPWACLACQSKFRFGQVRMTRDALRCPVCASSDIFAADGRTYEVDA